MDKIFEKTHVIKTDMGDIYISKLSKNICADWELPYGSYDVTDAFSSAQFPSLRIAINHVRELAQSD